MSKNQIWVLIAIVAIGVIALVSDVEIKVEVGTGDYATFEECVHKETLKCPEGLEMCGESSYYYCETFVFPKP